MPILKAPPAEPKNETLQLRVSQDLKFRLMRYAEFIHANASYVVTAALERLFRKDAVSLNLSKSVFGLESILGRVW